MSKTFHLFSDNGCWYRDETIRLSTTQLPLTVDGNGYESCIFYVHGDSEVVRRYATMADAIKGHRELETIFGVKE